MKKFFSILLIIVLLLSVIVLSAAVVYKIKVNNQVEAGQELYTMISQEAFSASFSENSDEHDELGMPSAGERTERKVGPDFDVLREINSDVVGFLEVPDTLISYPILYNENNGYYLKHNIDGTRGYPGCLYIENYNNPDLSDDFKVVYGHNMLDDTMFSELPKYRKEEFRNSHRYFYLYTPGEVKVYKVVMVSHYTPEHLFIEDFTIYENGTYKFNGFKGNESELLRDHLKEYGDSKAWFSGQDGTESSDYLVLSTCDGKNTRLIVAGVLVR